MSNIDPIQLGSVDISLPPLTPASSVPWSPVTPLALDSIKMSAPSSESTVQLLTRALDDPGLGFGAKWCQLERTVRIRCWMTPSDAPGSVWKKVRRKGREGVVKGLLGTLSRSWDDADRQGPALMGLTKDDDENMHDLYASVPSPPDPKLGWAASPLDEELYEALANYENPRGVRTNLYRYQLRSVARMLQMETQPQRLVDPLFTPFKEAGRDRMYYVNLDTWDVQRHPGWYDLPRGGVLCEQMGTGKTLMCLTLILSTLHQPTLPPTTDIDISPVSTDVAERTYPFVSHSRMRDLTGFPSHQTSFAFPSLVDLCANLLAIHDPSASKSPYLPPQVQTLLKRKTFYCKLPLPQDDSCSRAVKKVAVNTKVQKMFLAKGTIVVVPQILVPQWAREVDKHLEEGELNVLVADNRALPPIHKLLEYDVILMDVARFAHEGSELRQKVMQEPSVLLQARWKRIILDEGHVAHSKTTNAMRMAMNLGVDRRWIVSGTPTRHLQQGGEIQMEQLETSRSSTPTLYPTPAPSRAWNKRDLEDASRIGVMIGGFLAAEPFKSEGRFQRYVTAKLRGPQGPAFGAVQRMKYILGGVMVKHGPKVIDGEAGLPPSTVTKELVRFDPMQRITYNVLAALVSSNVHTSGGEDSDYFLHPRNVEAFNQVITNLHLACFWYSSREMGADACLSRTREWLAKHPDAPPATRAHLEEACEHLVTAINTPGWDEWMTNAISLPLDGSSFPSLIKHAWSDSFDAQPDMVDLHSAMTLRELNERGARLQDLHMEGWRMRMEKCEEFLEVLRKEKVSVDREKGKAVDQQVKTAKAKKGGKTAAGTAAQAPTSARQSPIKRTYKRKADELDENLNEAQKNAQKMMARLQSLRTDVPRPLSAVLQTRFRSAKVNFTIKTILEAPADDKFVIFGDSYELGHLTEGLDLLDITSTYVGHSLDSRHRRAQLDRFERPDIKVCLLDLKLAARGLNNLVVANRMIFLAPVWSPDVQAQAIKRVHRIGQTKPTKVQILVTEGTFEEDIAKRSTRGRSGNEEQLYTRAMIENPRFVYLEQEETHTFQIRFTPQGEAPTPVESMTSTPVEQLPVTPAGGSQQGRVRFAADGPGASEDEQEGERPEADRPSAMKRKDEQGASAVPKKRARVAFA
ncbi:hypothetical protein IAT38_002263 [Cryptococcus sp. DSM 104549]